MNNPLDYINNYKNLACKLYSESNISKPKKKAHFCISCAWWPSSIKSNCPALQNWCFFTWYIWWTHYLPKHCPVNNNNTQELMNWDTFKCHFTITCIWCSTATRFAICGAVLKLKFKLGGKKNNNRLSIVNTLFLKGCESVFVCL